MALTTAVASSTMSIATGVVFLVVWGVLTWLGRSAGAAAVVGERGERGERAMVYGPGWRVVTFATLVLPVGFAILAFRLKDDADARAGVAAVIFFSALWGLLWLEVSRDQYILGETALHKRTWWMRRPRAYEWARLSEVRYSDSWQALELVFGDQKVRLSKYLSGFTELGQAIEVRAPRSVATPQVVNLVMMTPER